jgi:hypothetical protein
MPYLRATCILFALACSGEPQAPLPPPGDPPSTTLAAPTDCATGTFASVQSGGCQPVGPQVLGAAFRKAADGFRIEATRPKTRCDSNARADLDDGCAGPFPVAAAKLVVSTEVAPAWNIKTVATIGEALALASNGDTIALDVGDYPTFETKKAIHLVGRCTEKVVLKADATRNTGVWFTGAGAASLSRVTVRDAKTGVRVGNPAADVTLTQVRLADNSNGVDSTGGTLHIRGSVIDGPWTEANPTCSGVAAQSGNIEVEDSVLQNLGVYVTAISPKASVTVRRSLLVGPTVETQSLSSVLATAGGGGTILLEESVLVSTQAIAYVDSGGSTQSAGRLTIVRSELLQNGKGELGMGASEGGSLTLDECSYTHKAFVGISVKGGELQMRNSTVVSTSPVAGSMGAIDVRNQSRVSIAQSAILDARGSAIGVLASTLELDQSFIARTTCVDTRARSLEVSDTAQVTVRGTTFQATRGIGVLAGSGATVSLESTLLDTPQVCVGAESSTGVGILIHDSNTALDRVLVRGAEGPALSYSSGSAIVKASRLIDSRVGILFMSADAIVDAQAEPSEFALGQLLLYRTVLEGNVDARRPADGYR